MSATGRRGRCISAGALDPDEAVVIGHRVIRYSRPASVYTGEVSGARRSCGGFTRADRAFRQAEAEEDERGAGGDPGTYDCIAGEAKD